MSDLTNAERDLLLAPCACGHTINNHGSLMACWTCEDDDAPVPCVVPFEDLLCQRVAVMVAGRVEAAQDGQKRALSEFQDPDGPDE